MIERIGKGLIVECWEKGTDRECWILIDARSGRVVAREYGTQGARLIDKTRPY